MELNVHYHTELPDEVIENLQSHLADGIQLTFGTEIPFHPTYHILINGKPDLTQLTASPNLYTLIIPYAGVPVKTRQLLLDFPHVKVHNLHYNAAATAEMAIALLMAAAKFLVPIDHKFRNHDWSPRYQPNPSLLLEGKSALILGFGSIGQRVARVCQSLGMRVIGIRNHPDRPLLPGVDAQVNPPGDLETLLPHVHVLIIALPFTGQTEGMIGAEQLALLAPGGILVNVGRGSIVDQAALYQALTTGTLAAAGLDVWYNYPQDEHQRYNTPPADYPFHQLDNIVMSPHRGGGAKDIDVLRMRHLAALLNALSRGEAETNLVDIKVGY
jgi:phosphoglycerate dehydrogenase-like enzyme